MPLSYQLLHLFLDKESEKGDWQIKPALRKYIIEVVAWWMATPLPTQIGTDDGGSPVEVKRASLGF